tara:strand:- start:2591 stop:3364 length:774 start_codon:yes stop_codon:yes gene_type:complete
MANKWIDPTGQYASWNEKNLRGETTYYLSTPKGELKFDTHEQRKAVYMRLIEPKFEVFDPNTGIYKEVKTKEDAAAYQTALKKKSQGKKKEKKIRDPQTIKTKLTKLDVEIQDLTDKENLNPYESEMLKQLKNQKKELYHEAGVDTTGISDFDIDASPPEQSGDFFSGVVDFLSGIFQDSDDGQLNKDKWMAKKRNEIMGLIAQGKLEVPEYYKGNNYAFRNDLAEELWKEKMEMPSIDKKVNELSSEELIRILDAN